MAHPSEIAFVWSDAWLLAALTVGGTDPRSLGQVLAHADALQHAVMTREELNGALGRLGRAELVLLEVDGCIRLSPTGEALCLRAHSGSYRDMQAFLERALNTAPWTSDYDPRGAQGTEADTVSKAMYAQLSRPFR